MTLLGETINNAFPAIFNKGDLIDDAVTVILDGGFVYDAWSSVSVTRSLEQVSGTFGIELVDKWRQSSEDWPLRPGVLVNVKIGKENVITGFIDQISCDVSNDDRSLSIAGRDVTGDLVDCSAVSDPSEFKNISIDALAKKFATDIFDIPVEMKATGVEPFEVFTVKQGESIFEMLERAAKLRGVLLLSDSKGSLVIANRAGESSPQSVSNLPKAPSLKNLAAEAVFSVTGVDRTSVALIQGENILEASASYDNSDRFAEYIIKGQAPGSDNFNGKSVTSVVAKATDEAIDRPRKKIVIADGSINTDSAKKRAQWEATIGAARSLEVVIKVQGWSEKPGGPLWSVNKIIQVEAGFIGLPEVELLITGVQFTKSIGEGTTTSLKLARVDAYDPEVELIKEKDPTQNLGWKSGNIKSSIAAAVQAGIK